MKWIDVRLQNYCRVAEVNFIEQVKCHARYSLLLYVPHFPKKNVETLVSICFIGSPSYVKYTYIQEQTHNYFPAIEILSVTITCHIR